VFRKEIMKLNQQTLGQSGTPVAIEGRIYNMLVANVNKSAELARRIDENDTKGEKIGEERPQIGE
jgi:hypothetical protein